MKGNAQIAFLLIVVVLLLDSAYGCAGCRNPNMPVTRFNAVHLRPGEIRTSMSLGATGVSVSHEAGCPDLVACAEVPIQPLYMHNQDIYPSEVRAIGEFGLTTALGVELQLPFRLIRTSIEYTTPEDKPYQPLDPDVHHRDETLIGVGDPWLLARWAGGLGSFTLSARAGLSVPIGKTEPNPFALGDLGKQHQHIQFGSGTVDPILALDVSKAIGRWMLSGYGQGQATLVENSHGYRAGLRISGGAQAGRKIWHSLTGAMGLETLYEGAEQWDGRIQQDGNLGRTEVLTALSLVQALPKYSMGLSARVPIYRNRVAGTEPAGKFSSPLMVGVFVGRTFNK